MYDTDFREDDVSRRRRRTEPATDSPGQEDDVLSSSPFSGDLEAELAKAPRGRRLPGLTTYLAAGVLLAVGFAIGAEADRNLGRHSSAQGGAPAAGAMGGGMPGGMPGGGRMPGGGMGGGRSPMGGGAMGPSGGTTGTVQKIDGNTIYVKSADGSTVQVKVTGDTKVGIVRGGSVKDLKSGASVTVQGDTGQDGTVTATSVSQNGSSGG
jgi:Domain of unknown function (DUF5666)